MAYCQLIRCGSRMAPTIVGTPMPHLRDSRTRACSLAITKSHHVTQRQPVAEAVAVHRGDHRLEDLPTALERVDGRLLPERARELAGRLPAVADVGAGAERAARAGHDRDPRVLVVAERARTRR